MKFLKKSDEERCVSSCRDAGQHSPRRTGRPRTTRLSKVKPSPKRAGATAFAEDFFLGHSESNVSGSQQDSGASKSLHRCDQDSLSCVYVG
jgi:hypothetical protein